MKTWSSILAAGAILALLSPVGQAAVGTAKSNLGVARVTADPNWYPYAYLSDPSLTRATNTVVHPPQEVRATADPNWYPYAYLSDPSLTRATSAITNATHEVRTTSDPNWYPYAYLSRPSTAKAAKANSGTRG